MLLMNVRGCRQLCIRVFGLVLLCVCRLLEDQLRISGLDMHTPPPSHTNPQILCDAHTLPPPTSHTPTSEPSSAHTSLPSTPAHTHTTHPTRPATQSVAGSTAPLAAIQEASSSVYESVTETGDGFGVEDEWGVHEDRVGCVVGGGDVGFGGSGRTTEPGSVPIPATPIVADRPAGSAATPAAAAGGPAAPRRPVSAWSGGARPPTGPGGAGVRRPVSAGPGSYNTYR